MLRTGWLPASLSAAFTGAVLLAYGVTLGEVLAFAAYLAVVVTLPGLLLWRLLRGGAGPIALDLAAGTALGYPLSLFAYLACRTLGVPQLAVAPSVAAIALFALLPRLRRTWRGSGERAALWWSWALCAIFVAMVVWSAVSFFRPHGLIQPGYTNPYPDMPFHLALAGEFKHHFPAEIPYVRGEALRYHWYFHAHAAAASWGSGVELQTLLLRLAVMPMLAALMTLLAYVGKAVAKVDWAGPAAVLVTFLSAAPFNRTSTGGPMGTIWVSPTQTFGAMIFAALAFVLIDLLRRTPTKRDWLLLALLAAGVTGAKATFLPMLAAALLLVAAVQLVAQRRIPRTALVALGITVLALAAAMIVLFSGSSSGMQFNPLAIRAAGGSTTRLLGLILFGWLTAWAGLIGLAITRRRPADPAIVLCLGLATAGVCAALMTTQPGGSQVYFLNSARPYIAAAALTGLAALLSRPMRPGRALIGGVLAGIMIFSAASAYTIYAPVRTALTKGMRAYPTTGPIPAGGVESARWLRDHSDPDDLVATNAHCLRLVHGACDARNFWISAYAERHMLVEGWAYTGTAMKVAGNRRDYALAPYWKPQLLAENDAAFNAPSAANVDLLRSRYGVRWLVVDKRLAPGWASIGAYAELRADLGDVAVFEITG